MTLLRRVTGLALGALLLAGLALADDKDLVPLPLKLPRPHFAGTPKDVPPECKDVEPPSDKPRPIPMVPKGTANVALHKRVTCSGGQTFNGSLELVTDGDKEAYDGSAVELRPKLQWIQIDLGKTQALQFIAFWHCHTEANVVHDVVVQISSDPEFIDEVKTLFNNDKDNSAGLGAGQDKEYWETFEGKLVACKGARARYVRLYSRGSTLGDPLNRYTEVEVYGVPQ
ncbi:MAG: discoidin domain-containing protein [Armatimonadetes bacterium]|nr:discoidin domain-containing protein [Armatimonadota bacterium]